MYEHPWMSKDLLVRLRWWSFKFCGKNERENFAADDMSEAANRIEKLEAALRKYADEEYNGFNACGAHARKALEDKQ